MDGWMYFINMMFQTYLASNKVHFDEVLGSDNDCEENGRLNAKQLLTLLTRSSSYKPEELLDILNSKTVKLHKLLKHIRSEEHNCVCRDVLTWESLILILGNGDINDLVNLLLHEAYQPESRLSYQPLLFDPYRVWYSRSAPQSTISSTSGGQLGPQLVRLTTFYEWTQLCSMYPHLQHPSGLPLYSNLMIFKNGIKPVPTDSANVDGGQWIIRFKSEYVDFAWFTISVECMKNIRFLRAEVCGFVLSLRPKMSYVSVWNRFANVSAASRVGETLRTYLFDTPMREAPMQYKVHRKQPIG